MRTDSVLRNVKLRVVGQTAHVSNRVLKELDTILVNGGGVGLKPLRGVILSDLLFGPKELQVHPLHRLAGLPLINIGRGIRKLSPKLEKMEVNLFGSLSGRGLLKRVRAGPRSPEIRHRCGSEVGILFRGRL